MQHAQKCVKIFIANMKAVKVRKVSSRNHKKYVRCYRGLCSRNKVKWASYF